MNKKYPTKTISPVIEKMIYTVRGHRVMFDADLAELYTVSTKALNQTVMRNQDRFPEDFMFRLTAEEARLMRSQFVTGSKRNLRYSPLAFTEQGVAMLSGLLRSSRATQVNIGIMRAFVRMRQLLSANLELEEKLNLLESKLMAHDDQITDIVEAIRALMLPPDKQTPKIGYNPT